MILITMYLSGKRKPDPDFYLDALKHLEVDPANCIFVDDRYIFLILLIIG